MSKEAAPEYWRDRDRLLSEYQAHGTLEEVCAAHGQPSMATIRKWWKIHRLPELQRGMRYKGEDETSDFEELVLAQLQKLGDKATLVELANTVDASPRRVEEALSALDHQGFRVSHVESEVVLNKMPPPSDNVHKAQALFDGDHVRFAVISDTHLGSKHCLLDALHTAYERCKIEGVTTVYHPGDIVCGVGVYRTQVSEINIHTYKEQVAYAAENYPKVDGITTRLIGGNHDMEGDFAKVGANAALGVANQRDDIVYDGDYHAWYEMPNGAWLYTVHPMGGSSYARSYKLQKFAESFEGGRKPNVLFAGHYHDMMYMQERGIQMLKAGTFEANGSLGLRAPLRPVQIGFWLVDMWLGDDGSVVRFRPEWFPFYAGRTARRRR